MSRITELFEEIAESITGFGDELTRAGTEGRKYQDIENERLVEGLYKNDPLLLEGLSLALSGGTLGAVKTAAMTPKWLAPYIGRASTHGISPSAKSVSGARVGTDVAGRAPMPVSKTPSPTVRGPRGNTNIDAPVQRNLDLSDLKPTGIQNTTQARGMNPKMRESLTTRRDNIQQDIFKMEGQGRLNESVDMQKLFRLQDELKALNKTLLD